jgi:hypothetical protein
MFVFATEQYSLIKKGESAEMVEHSETYRILHLLFLQANVIAWYGLRMEG